MTAGAERIEYGHLGQAHTDGDIYVFFRGSNVLVAGDAMTVGEYPIADYTTRRLARRTDRRQQDAARPGERRHAHRARHRPDPDARRPAGAARHARGDAAIGSPR